jgi:hypothetical protein
MKVALVTALIFAVAFTGCATNQASATRSQTFARVTENRPAHPELAGMTKAQIDRLLERFQ